MTVVSIEEACRRLDQLLDEARSQGEIRIRRPGGDEFVVRPAARSPLDVDGLQLNLSANDIVSSVRESRER
jgi:hypothetical protein